MLVAATFLLCLYYIMCVKLYGCQRFVIVLRPPPDQIPFAVRLDSVRYTMTFREQKDEAACGSDRFVEVVQHERAEHDKRYRYHERNMKQRCPLG